MSDLVITVVENTPTVTVSDATTAVDIVEAVTTLTVSNVGMQGIQGVQGATGATGPQGSSGVIAVTSPITNSGTSTSAQLGLNQSAITLAQSQVTNLTTDLAAKAALTADQTFTGLQTLTASSTTANILRTKTLIGVSGGNPWSNVDNNDVTTFFVDYNANAVFGRLRLHNGTVASSSAARLVVETYATQVGAIVKGAASQTADLLQVQDSAAAVLFRITSAGRPQVNARMGIAPAGATSNFNATLTVADVTGGASNIQEWQNASGTLLARVTSTGLGSFNGGLRGFDQSYVQGATAGTVQFFVRGAASQTADLTQWQTSDSVVHAGINASGFLFVGGSSSPGGQLGVQAETATNRPLVVKGAASQSANLTEWQDSTGTVLARIGSTGAIVGTGLAIFGSNAAIANNQVGITSTAATNIGLIVKGAASQSANLQEWQDSSGSPKALINSYGGGQMIDLKVNTSSSYGSIGIVPGTVSQIGFVYRGLASQVADAQQYQTSAAAVLGGRNALAQIYTGSTTPLTTAVGGATTAASGTGTTATLTTTSNHNLAVGDRITVAGVTPTGYNGTFIVTAAATNSVSYANATTGAQTVAGTVSVDAQASITSRSAATTGLIVKAAASASSNLQEWQASGGNVLASVAAGGNALFNGITNTGTLNAGAFVRVNSFTNNQFGGSGIIGIANGTAPTSNPTGGGVLYVNSGALTWIGTSGSARTIVNADGTDPNPANGTTSTAASGIGFMGLPQNATTTGAYTVVAADAGKHIYASATRTVTIDSNANLAFPSGTTLTFIAGSGATMTIAITTDTMYLAGAGTTGSRTLAPFGMATAVKLTATTWIISGNGLT